MFFNSVFLVVPGAPISRKHSLSLPPSGPRPGHNGSMGGGGGGGGGLGEVDLSAYKSMAASLQAQTEAHQVRCTTSVSHGTPVSVRSLEFLDLMRCTDICVVLCCAVPCYSATLYCTMLCCAVLQCAVLCSTVQCSTV